MAASISSSEVVGRLTRLVASIKDHGKHRLLAFDKHYRSDGSVDLEKTEFYVPNEYVFELAERHPDLFMPNISVNPSDPKCDPFYQKMKELDLILLSHGGEEKAVEAEEDQKLGNPLLLRRALDHGVKVIVAHCAGLGSNEDLDSKDRKVVDNFDLFLRLMDEKRYEGLVFGKISAMTQFNRSGKRSRPQFSWPTLLYPSRVRENPWLKRYYSNDVSARFL